MHTLTSKSVFRARQYRRSRLSADLGQEGGADTQERAGHHLRFLSLRLVSMRPLLVFISRMRVLQLLTLNSRMRVLVLLFASMQQSVRRQHEVNVSKDNHVFEI